MTSAPPAVSIFTTLGATFADAAFIAFSVASFTSVFGCAAAPRAASRGGDREPEPRRGRVSVRVIGVVPFGGL